MKAPFIFYCFTVILLLLNLTGHSQPGMVQISTAYNSDNTVDINYKKAIEGSIYLKLTFDRLENSTSISTFYNGTIVYSQGKLLTLRPVKENSQISCSFKYTWIRGKLVSKIDTAFIYLLPVSKGKTVKVLNHTYLYKEYFGNAEPKNWRSFQFNVEPGDTVFSARKGIVVEVTDEFDPDTTAIVSFSNHANSLLIEHEDGTLAYYGVLKKGSFLVKPGQVVFPHTPLALAGTFDTDENTQIRFSVRYLIEEQIDKPTNKTLSSKTNYYTYVNPLFHTTEGEVQLKAFQDYTADFTFEHIIKELSKKEKKKIGY
jgi:hypothetical protein